MSMTTELELAQRMKAAAIRAKAATEDYVANRMSMSVCLSECEEFNNLSDGPDNIIALVEALAAALIRNAEQVGIIAKQEKWIKDVEAIMISATDRAEDAEKRIAELQISRDKCLLSGLKTGWEYGIADDTEGYNREIADAQAVIDRAAGVAVEGE